ncbi:MAG TPA: sigma-70 family RNA polymerase sigma factor [Bacteroidales bacterium]|nr:sigma-70 family RNA polymerase sigma factor [Bacteroidales bacterium]HPS18452.1 sigma-70 family RNA polymerase sigma factor [Bacteroidales bacterium]
MGDIYINIPDEELIRGCLTHNDEKYFSMIYKKYFGKMYHVCKRYAINKEEAEDLAQEGFIIILKNLKKFEFKGSFEGWMRRIMVNNAINYIKSKKKLKFIESIDDGIPIPDEDSLPVSNDEIKNCISSESLMNLISNLPPVYKMIFNMYAIDGYSHKDIADSLGIQESTSRSNLAKARIILKKSVEDILIKERASYA